MNKLIGKIIAIQSQDNLSMVKVSIDDAIIFTSIVLDIPATSDYLILGKTVQVLFKETEIIISTDLTLNISIQNKFTCCIQSINEGVLLSQVNLIFGNIIISSVITTNACKQLALKENDIVLALIKTNEVSIAYD